jgi:hypothetical protein
MDRGKPTGQEMGCWGEKKCGLVTSAARNTVGLSVQAALLSSHGGHDCCLLA